MAIYDGFTFFNELDILEIRLNELAEIVDRFILVEARTTFSGNPKPLWFADNKERFAAFLDRIEHIVIDAFPPSKTPWDREFFQRRAIMRGLASASADDFVVVSDVDEIPRAEALADLIERGVHRGVLTIFGMNEFLFRLNLHRAGFVWWLGSRMIERRLLRDPQAIRKLKAIPSLSPAAKPFLPLMRAAQSFGATGWPLRYELLTNAGWHFTSMGDGAQVAEKIRAYSHQEYNRPDLINEAHIDGVIAAGRSLLLPDVKLSVVDIDEMLPAHVGANKKRFAALLA